MNHQATDALNTGKKNKRISKPLQLLLLVALGIIFILTAIILRKVMTDTVLPDLLNSIGDALIIGPALSWILDLPSMVDYFRKITVESLISKDYLSSLPRNTLLELRKDCTQKIHLKDSDRVEKGLIQMDENVCELLTQQYCERYRQNTMCRVVGDKLVKKHYIEESIVNPLSTKVQYKEFPLTNLDMTDGQSVDDVYKILSLTVKIDDSPEEDIKSKVIIIDKVIDQPDVHFNRELSWMDAQSPTKLFTVDFTKSLIISRVVEVTTPLTDTLFIKRVKMPVKSLKVDYTYDRNDVKLIGACFGTMAYPSDGKLKVIQEKNYISIEAFEWILPGNGIFIANIPV
jgi:hypothetical protein